MRKTEASGLMTKTSSRALTRALRLSAVALGIGLLMAAGVARAQDDEDGDDKTFEEKLIDNVMRGMGAQGGMEHRGIDYRERAPLVVPPNLDLPPPVNAKSEVNVPNWPKDADEARRKAARTANKKAKAVPWYEAARPLSPEELNKGKTAATTSSSNEHIEPGPSGPTLMSPSELGFKAKLSTIFGGNKAETTPFNGEPPRQELTQPPAGYQTPSPNFAYGTGKQLAPLNNSHFDIVSGKDMTY